MHNTNKNNLPFSCLAEGHSMYPVINSGDIVTLIPSNKYSKNDIVLFSINSELILHRIVCTFTCAGHEYFITKGDANSYDDEPIPSKQILGKVVQIKKQL